MGIFGHPILQACRDCLWDLSRHPLPRGWQNLRAPPHCPPREPPPASWQSLLGGQSRRSRPSPQRPTPGRLGLAGCTPKEHPWEGPARAPCRWVAALTLANLRVPWHPARGRLFVPAVAAGCGGIAPRGAGEAGMGVSPPGPARPATRLHSRTSARTAAPARRTGWGAPCAETPGAQVVARPRRQKELIRAEEAAGGTGRGSPRGWASLP